MSDSHDDHGSSSSGGYNFAPLLGTLTMIGVPIAMVVMLGISGYAFMQGAGVKQDVDTAPAVAAPNPSGASAPSGPDVAGVDPAVMAIGQTAYANCLACHGADGKGMQAGQSMMAPSLAGSELLLGDPDKSLLIVLKGIQKETADYMGVMAPLGATLDDEKLAAVLTYARNSFGNSAGPITPEQAAAARAKFTEVPMMLSRPKIDEIVEAHK
jgi:mono/diheme cytochrome c family protein